MSQLILCLCLALQGAPSQADLHPGRSDVYLEVPDVPAVLAAYEEAPLVKTARIEGVRELLSALDLDATITLRGALGLLAARFVAGGADLIDQARSCSFSLVMDGENTEEPFGAELVVAFSSADAARHALELALSSGSPAGGLDVASLPDGRRFTSDALEGVQLWCATVGERLVLGAGSCAPADVAARLAGSQAGFGADANLRHARELLGPGEGTTVFWMAGNRSPLALLRDTSLAGAADLGLADSFDPLAGAHVMRMQMRGERFVTEVFSPGGKEHGALGGRPVDPAWLDRIPADVMLAYSTSADGAKLVPVLGGLLTTLSQALPAGPDEAEGDPLSAILSGLGPGMAVYVFPLGGIGAPQTHAWIDAADPAAFTEKVTALCQRLAEEHPGVGTRTRDYKVTDPATDERVPFPVTSVTLPPDALGLGPMFPIDPAFAEAKGGILFGLSSMHVKRELKRLYGGADADEGTNPFRAHGFAVPADARSVVFMDWGLQIEKAFDLARALGGMMGDEAPVDVSTLPEAKTFTQYLRPTFDYTRDVEGGSYRRHESSFGPLTWGLIAGGLFLGAESSEMPEAEPLPPGGEWIHADDGGEEGDKGDEDGESGGGDGG